MKLILFFLCTFFLTRSQLLGQEKEVFWNQVIKNSISQNPKTRLEEALNQKRIKETSKKTTDSVYAKILHVMARSYWELGDYTSALKYSKLSIAVNLSKKNALGNKNHAAITYYNLSKIYLEIQNYREALVCLDNFLNIWNELNIFSPSTISAYNMKSEIFFLTGDYSNSLQNSEKASKFNKNQPEILLHSLLLQVQALIKMDKQNAARNVLNKAYEIIFKNNFQNNLSTANYYFLL